MSNLDDLCNKMQNLSPEKRKDLILESLNDCLTHVTQSGLNKDEALETIIGIVCCAIAADGRFAADEYPYIAALLSVQNSSKNYSYDYCKSYINNIRGGGILERETTKFIRSLGSLNGDMQNSLILLCMLICSVDGTISSDERSFLSNLF